jgi:hypothetical protein
MKADWRALNEKWRSKIVDALSPQTRREIAKAFKEMKRQYTHK